MAILELKDVTKKFGGLTAVDGVNLKVDEPAHGGLSLAVKVYAGSSCNGGDDSMYG